MLNMPPSQTPRPKLGRLPPPPPEKELPLPPFPPLPPLPPLPAFPRMMPRRIRKTHHEPAAPPTPIIDLHSLTSNPHIITAIAPLLAQWSASLTPSEVAHYRRIPAQEAEGQFVNELVETLEAEKRRRRAAESRVKMLEEAWDEVWRVKHEAVEDMRALLWRREREMREEGEWMCARGREMGVEMEELRERVRGLEGELRNLRRRVEREESDGVYGM